MIFQNCQKKSKRRESNRVNRPADQNFRRGKKWTFMLSQFLEWTFMSDQICRMKKNEKKTKKIKKNELFRFFHFFFILKVHFFSGPQKKFILKFCPRQKFIFCSFRKNVRSKSLFFVYLLVSKFQVQIPYPKPALNPKSLGFRV